MHRHTAAVKSVIHVIGCATKKTSIAKKLSRDFSCLSNKHKPKTCGLFIFFIKKRNRDSTCCCLYLSLLYLNKGKKKEFKRKDKYVVVVDGSATLAIFINIIYFRLCVTICRLPLFFVQHFKFEKKYISLFFLCLFCF
jgi:hypothetical protein